MLPRFTHRWLVVLSLLGLLLLAVAPSQSAIARPQDQIKRNRSTLCGRLVFLEDYKTGAKMIGLIPCNENRPLIFAAGPAELYNFYRFTNVVIKKGDKVTTLAYGTLENYITRFDSYKQISSCSECDSTASGVSPASAGQAGDCSAWVLDQAATTFPASNLAQETETLQQNLQAYAEGEVATRQCGVDRACRIEAVSQQLGVQLGPRLHWGGITTDQTIGWLAELLTDPATTEACPSIALVAPALVVGLNQQGYGIDLAAIQDGCDLVASDEQGRKVGFESGSALEDVPGARAAAAPQGQYLLLPAGSASQLSLACTKSDLVNMQFTRRDATDIQLYTFSRLPVQSRTQGVVNLYASPPVLSLDVRGDGNSQDHSPDQRQTNPALVALLVPSPTAGASVKPVSTASPTVEATLTSAPTLPPVPPSSTPVPTVAPTPTTVPPFGPSGLCPFAIGAALLPGIFWWRRRSAARHGSISS